MKVILLLRSSAKLILLPDRSSGRWEKLIFFFFLHLKGNFEIQLAKIKNKKKKVATFVIVTVAHCSRSVHQITFKKKRRHFFHNKIEHVSFSILQILGFSRKQIQN